MQRVLFIVLIVVGLMLWFAIRSRRTNKTLSTALFAASAAIMLLVIGGFFGIIGG